MITISAFRWVPPFAQGQVRDLRVRWALEEAQLPYRRACWSRAIRTNPTTARYNPSARYRSLRRVVRHCSRAAQ